MCQDLFSKFFKNKKHSKGYTLIEIMVSMLIFGIVTVSLSLPICQSVYLTVNNEGIVKANNLARLYLKNTEILWKTIGNYDRNVLPDSGNSSVAAGQHNITSTAYTDDNNYEVKAYIENLSSNDLGVTVVKRVRIVYKDTNGKNLADIYMDYDRR
jgi:prepilin-type N-terminal cleavage/methylation domain-containing protein